MNKVHTIFRFIKLQNVWILLTLLLFDSCDPGKTGNSNPNKYVNQVDIIYAKRFELNHSRGYSRLSIINPWQGADDIIQEYYLVRRDDPIPAGIDPSVIIRVPLEKVVCMSTTHLAMISALEEESSIKGFSGTGFIYNRSLSMKASEGELLDIGFDNNMNKELILKMDPDLIMVYGVGSESAGYAARLRELGLKVLFNADYLETDPLGKAEWIKMIGALYCKEAAADSIFRYIETRYNRIKDSVRINVREKPSVLLGLPFKDTWFISPGNSYISQLIEDAGGDYLWKGRVSSVSMPSGLETVYLKAIGADFWLNSGSAESLDEIRSLDPRLSDLRCFKTGNVFNNNRRLSPGGGNDYWESGSLRQDIILKDLVAILHPGHIPQKELFYYKKLK